MENQSLAARLIALAIYIALLSTTAAVASTVLGFFLGIVWASATYTRNLLIGA